MFPSRCCIAPDGSRCSRCSSMRTAICSPMPAAKSCRRWRASSAAFPFRFASSRTSSGSRMRTRNKQIAEREIASVRRRSRMLDLSPRRIHRRGQRLAAPGSGSPMPRARSTAAWMWKFGDNRAAMQQPQYVYYFGDGHAEGNAKMKDVLGGKGAGLAEMTNIGVPVPPGFTISTAVCTYFYDHDKTYPPELKDAVAENLARVEKSVGRKFGDRDEAAARLRPLRRARVDARHDGHDPQPRPERRDGAGPGEVVAATSASRSIRIAASSRCTPTSCWRSTASISSTSSSRCASKSGVKTDAEIPAEALRELVDTYKGIVREKAGNDFPQDVQRAALGRDRRGVQLLEQPARHHLSQAESDPRRLGHRGQRAVDGLRQHGRRLRDRRRLHAQSVDRRAALLRRVPAERAGRGRRRRHPHAAADLESAGDRRREVARRDDARGLRAARGRLQETRSRTTATCRTSSSRSSRASSISCRRAPASAPASRR